MQASRIIRTSGAVLAATTALGMVVPTVAAQAPVLQDDSARQTTSEKATAVTAMNYRVCEGDTLESIAQSTGTAAAVIAYANKLVSSAIRTGQHLSIPVPTAQLVASKTTAVTYVVKSGDTLSGIAKKYGTTVSAIASASAVTNVNRISIGQKLTIPSKTTTASSTTTSNTAASSNTTSSATASQTYVVRSGDTLSSIAKKYGTTVSAIASASAVTNVNRISIGQKLTIPGKTTTASSTTTSNTTSVPNTFLGYTYSSGTTAAANQNKAALNAMTVPSRANMQTMVRQVAISMGVDPTLALAHAYVESGFDARAVSPANAVGVMQVIPSSGVWASQMVGRELNLLDPYDNVVAGVAIIRYLDRNASSKDQAIAGYYQGLAGVKKNGMKSDTVAYVAKVKAAMARF